MGIYSIVVTSFKKYSTLIIIIVFFLSGCISADHQGTPSFEEKIEYYESGVIRLKCDGYIVEEFDTNGQILVEYGNQRSYDNDINYKVLYCYTGDTLIQSHTFFFNDTTDFVIRDSNEFRNDFHYFNGIKTFLRFFPVYVSSGAFTGDRVLGFWGQEEDENSTNLDHDISDTNNLEIARFLNKLNKQKQTSYTR